MNNDLKQIHSFVAEKVLTSLHPDLTDAQINSNLLLGFSPDLSQLLIAMPLGYKIENLDDDLHENFISIRALHCTLLIKWDLAQIFRKQSPETQERIAKLLGWKGEVGL